MKNIWSHNNHILIYSTRRGLSSCILPRFNLHKTDFWVVPLPRNGSERNSDSLFLFLFHGTEFRVVFSSEEGFGTEFQEYASTERNSELFSLSWKGSERNSERFLFRGTAGIPSEMNICSVSSVFRGIIFCRKFPTLPVISRNWEKLASNFISQLTITFTARNTSISMNNGKRP